MIRALLACVVSGLIVGLFFGVFTWIEEEFRTSSFLPASVGAFVFGLLIAFLVGLPFLRLARKRNIIGGWYYARAGLFVAAAVVLGVVVAVRKFDLFAAKAALFLLVSGAVAGFAFNRIANATPKVKPTAP